VTSSRVAGAGEKKRLAATYEAALVDMEAAGVARLAKMRGIPFYCVKESATDPPINFLISIALFRQTASLS